MNKILAPALVGLFGFALAWAFHLPVMLALIVGAGAAVTSLIVSSLGGDQEKNPSLDEALRAPDVVAFYTRAQAAVNDIDTLTLAAPGVDGSGARLSAHQVLEEFTRTAQGLLSLDRALSRINIDNVRNDYQLLSREAANLKRPPSTLLDSLNVLKTQLNSASRLTEMRTHHLSTLRSCAIGLEGIASQISEIQAMSSSANNFSITPESLGDVSLSLESLRSGIAESKRLNQELLEGF